MKIGKDEVPNFMTFNYSFVGAKMLGGFLQPTVWDLEMEMVMVIDHDNPAHAKEDFSDAIFNKLMFWLETTMPNIVISDIANPQGMTLVTSVDNAMMYTPGEPYDDLIVKLLHAKISTILGPHLALGRVKLKSMDQMVAYNFSLHQSEGYQLPTKIEEYCPLETLHDTPWWFRTDGFCFDFVLPVDEEERVKATEDYKNIIDPLEQFTEYQEQMEKESNAESDSGTDADAPTAEIIELPWQPKKI